MHYNAAHLHQATLFQQDAKTFNEDSAVNIGGAQTALQISFNIMSPRRSGTILLTGGGFAIHPNPNFISLSLGKAGIHALALGLFDTAREKDVHVATVTVAALVQPESKEAKGIADAFWDLHSQKKENWTAETTFAG